MDISTAVIGLYALAQESRLQIFRLLVQQGPDGLCVGSIAARLDIAPATLSFHLKELQRAGLLTARRQSRHIYYAADFSAMDALVNYLTENCCGGAACEVSVKRPAKRKKSAK